MAITSQTYFVPTAIIIAKILRTKKNRRDLVASPVIYKYGAR